MKIAAFTIVKDEKEFLPLWINYYKKNADYILILDHETKDGSTTNLDVDVKKIKNEYIYDHEWLLEQVKNTQQQLLKEYDVVIFAEVDEFLIPTQTTLKEYIIQNKDKKAIMATAFDVYQEKDEDTVKFNNQALLQRRNMTYSYDMCKVLISQIPIEWDTGFHNANNLLEIEEDPNLYLIHIHRLNKDYAYQRRLIRTQNKWKQKDLDLKRGWHYWLTEQKDFEKWYYPQEKQKIPNHIKKIFYEQTKQS